MAIGPMPASLVSMPVAKDCAMNGRSTLSNSLGSVLGAALGMPACAAMNMALVDGMSTGAGAMPKFGGVVLPTLGSAPRFTLLPSDCAFTPGVGSSRLPAMSVASARNS